MKFLISILSLVAVFVSRSQEATASSDLEIFGDHIFIKLGIDGSKPLDFIFDTGDGLTIVDTDVALALGIHLDYSSKQISAQGSVEGTLTKHNSVEMDGVILEKDIKIYATNLKHLEINIGRNIDGIIGYDLLNHYTVILDEFNRKIKLYNPETFSYKGAGQKLHMRFNKGMPHVSAKVTLNNGEVLDGQYFVSTGAATTMDFNSPFAKKNKIIDKTGEHYSYLTKGISDTESLHYEGRVKKFKLGNLNFDNMPVGISLASKGAQANKKMSGIIGNRILKNYIVIIDKTNKSMYLETHLNTSSEFHVNACGFEIQMDSDSENMMIYKVYEIGAGREKDIKVHDVILKINGVASSEMSLPQAVRILNNPMKEVTLELIDDKNIRKVVSFTPRKLI